jgi:prepilin-type N-terminal cleavage/methylation domain-containing protein/prepilin-type processing-associated H-X9-DG protein
MVCPRNRKGFTLVELLIVIGIIALLISILLPALTRARESANAVVCMSNMRQFGLGIQMYADQNKGELPQKGPDGSSPAQAFGQNGQPYNDVIGFDDPSIWFNAIPPMVNGQSYFQMIYANYQGKMTLPKANAGFRSIFICPSATDAGTFYAGDTIKNGYFELQGTESSTNPQKIFNSGGLVGAGVFPFDSQYCFNSKLLSSIANTDVEVVKMSQCRPASNVVMLTEKLNNPGEYKISDVQRYVAAYPGAYTSNSSGPEVNASGYISNIGQAKADWRRFTTRHNKGGNLLFADGHVSHYPWTEVQIQPSEMPGGAYSANTSDANQPSKIIWSIVGPVN